MVNGEVTTLYKDKEQTIGLFPRTKTSAISNADGRGLDAIIENIETEISNRQTIIEHGAELPAAGNPGRIFLKEVTN